MKYIAKDKKTGNDKEKHRNFKMSVETGRIIYTVNFDKSSIENTTDQFFKKLELSVDAETYSKDYLDEFNNVMFNTDSLNMKRNGIYILLKKVKSDDEDDPDDQYTKVYVGQFDQQTAFTRIKQHITDDISSKWNVGFVFKKSIWNSNDVDRLEQEIYSLLEKHKEQKSIEIDEIVNGKNPDKKQATYLKAIDKLITDEHREDIISIFQLMRSYGVNAFDKIIEDLNNERIKYNESLKNQNKSTNKENLYEKPVPDEIVKDMIDMLFEQIDENLGAEYDKQEVNQLMNKDQNIYKRNKSNYISGHIKNFRFLDVALKNEFEFLTYLYDVLMNRLSGVIENRIERQQHIINNQLFGLALNDEVANKVGKIMGYHQVMKYGHEVDVRNITKINHYRDALKQYQNKDSDVLNNIFKKDGDFYNMDFDVVIGNPPYNGDTYIDFVRFGFRKATKYVCMITPAKWVVMDDMDTFSESEWFRNNIVPYMNKIVYFPNCKDVFKTVNEKGITYFLLDKKRKAMPLVKNRDEIEKHTGFNSDFEEIDIIKNKSLYNSTIQQIIRKMHTDDKIHFCKDIKKYNLIATSALNGGNSGNDGSFYNVNDGKISVVANLRMVSNEEYNKKSGSSVEVYFQSDELSECESFKSYVDTKTIRFLVFLGLYTRNVRDDTTWRFVPVPDAFDHIFTDEELYKKYELSADEIDIIESVINDRRKSKKSNKKKDKKSNKKSEELTE